METAATLDDELGAGQGCFNGRAPQV
jgi:hypothetical protein